MLQDFVRTSVTWNLTVSALILIKGQMEMEIINVNWIILLVKDTRRIWGRTKIFFIIQLRYVLTANLSIKKRKKKHQINHSNLFEFLIKKGGAERRNCYLYWLCLNLKRDTISEDTNWRNTSKTSMSIIYLLYILSQLIIIPLAAERLRYKPL